MLQSSNHNGSELKWVEGFIIGSVIEGKVHESNDFGVVVSFEEHSDVYGFITHHQCKFFFMSTEFSLSSIL